VTFSDRPESAVNVLRTRTRSPQSVINVPLLVVRSTGFERAKIYREYQKEFTIVALYNGVRQAKSKLGKEINMHRTYFVLRRMKKFHQRDKRLRPQNKQILQASNVTPTNIFPTIRHAFITRDLS